MATQEQLDVIYKSQLANKQTALSKNNVSDMGVIEVTDKKETKGPLKSLYQNPYAKKALFYPRDLGQLDKGHSIQFDIRDIKPADIPSAIQAASDKLKDLSKVRSVEEATSSLEQNVKNGVEFLQNNKDSFSDYLNQNILDMKSETTEIVNTLRLYMPDSLQFSYDAQYDKLSLAEAINSVPLVGNVSRAITSTLGEREIGRAVTNKLGYTFNPQQQTLFEGIDFREFEMDFAFTPTSREEAVTVQEIIKILRIAAAPTKVKSVGGFFFVPPSVFNISFFFNSQINYSIPPIRPCVLQNITVNYAPNGWAAMKDGSPVQTTITLSFRELDLVDRDNIKEEMTMSGAPQ